jgi:hypothetical protein
MFEKDPAEALDYAVEFESHCTKLREPNTTYALDARVRPARATGLQYKATAGVTGTDEPRWPTAATLTVVDGSVTWTAEAMSSGSLARTLASCIWTLDSGITASGQIDTATRSLAIISGGVLGQRYSVRVDATFTDGTVRTELFTIKIARPRTIDA